MCENSDKNGISIIEEILERNISTEPVGINDCEKVRKRTNRYLKACDDANRPPTRVGVIASLGISRLTYENWKKKQPEHPTIQYLENIFEMIADNIESGGLTGKFSSQMANFVLRTAHDYKDDRETTIIHKKFDEKKSIEQLESEIENQIIDADFTEIDDG